MALSSHRKLNVEQLINLAQVYWDDPGKLMEIVEATEARVDPAAQLLFGAVTNRLSRLRSDPLRALGQAPPDLAALIAARLGAQPSASAASAEQFVSAPGEPASRSEKARRRWPWAAAAALLLTAGGASWLWPDPEISQTATQPREVGIEIQEGGLVARDEEEKKGGSSGLPAGRRRAEFAPPAERERRAHEADEEEIAAAEAAERRARSPAAAVVKELEEPAEPRAVRAAAGAAERSDTGSTATGSGGTGQVGPVVSLAERRALQTTGSAGGTGRAGAVITVDDALLECFLTDRRPAACTPPRARGAAAAATGGGAAAGGSSAPRPSREAAAAPSGGGGSRGDAARASGSGERAQGGGGTGGGGASAAGGGAASGAGSPEGSRSRAAQRPSAAAASGGADQSPPAKSSPRQPVLAAAPDPECPEDPAQGRVVFIFDGSISMGLPLGLDPGEEDRLDEGVRRKDPEARRAYRALLQQPGPKRMARAQAAFADAAADLPDDVELGLVVFQECRDIRSVGVFDAAARGSAIDYVQRVVPRGRTPLAQSLASAAGMLGDGPSSIVLLTDGIEFCSGDPCAVAQELKASHPRTPIHIIDVTGQARTACVAEITGGRSYAPAETDDLARVIRSALRGAAPRCGAPG